MPKGRKIRKRVRQSAEPSRFVWILLGFVVVALLIGSSLITFLSQRDWVLPWEQRPVSDYNTTSSKSASKEIPPELRRRTSAVISNDTSTALGLIAAYVRRNGGNDTLAPLKTVLIKGNLTFDGHLYDFEMFKKEPAKLRLQLQDKKGLLILASNGNQTWEGYRTGAGIVRWWSLSGDTADWIWLQAPLGGWLLQPTSSTIQIALDTKMDNPSGASILLPLTINSSGGRRIVYYLDADTFLPHRLALLDKDTSTPVQSVDFSNISVAGGVWMPHTILSTNAKSEKTTLQLTKITFNSGVFNEVFDPPSGIEATKPSGTASQSANAPPDLSSYGFPWALPW